MLRYIVYGLVDPRDGHVRYVGKSTTGMKRPWMHVRPRALKETNYKARWVRSLLARGLMYGIVVLYQSPVRQGLEVAEEFWITEMRSRSFPLTNTAPGGLGGLGGTLSCAPETRKKISAALRGHQMSMETRRKISESKTGAKLPDRGAEWRRKVGDSHRGGRLTDEHKEKLSAAKKGRKLTDEHRANISAAMRRKACS